MLEVAATIILMLIGALGFFLVGRGRGYSKGYNDGWQDRSRKVETIFDGGSEEEPWTEEEIDEFIEEMENEDFFPEEWDDE